MSLTAYRFITRGSSNLVDAVLVFSAVHNIKSMNLLGSAHMQLNARVLYHNLLNIEPEGDLPRSFAYFRWFDKGPEAIILAAKRGELVFTYEELKVLVELCYSEAVESRDEDEAKKGKNSLDDGLLQLSEAMWQK